MIPILSTVTVSLGCMSHRWPSHKGEVGEEFRFESLGDYGAGGILEG